MRLTDFSIVVYLWWFQMVDTEDLTNGFDVDPCEYGFDPNDSLRRSLPSPVSGLRRSPSFEVPGCSEGPGVETLTRREFRDLETRTLPSPLEFLETLWKSR